MVRKRSRSQTKNGNCSMSNPFPNILQGEHVDPMARDPEFPLRCWFWKLNLCSRKRFRKKICTLSDTMRRISSLLQLIWFKLIHSYENENVFSIQLCKWSGCWNRQLNWVKRQVACFVIARFFAAPYQILHGRKVSLINFESTRHCLFAS